jgi:hypothetical protein
MTHTTFAEKYNPPIGEPQNLAYLNEKDQLLLMNSTRPTRPTPRELANSENSTGPKS